MTKCKIKPNIMKTHVHEEQQTATRRGKLDLFLSLLVADTLYIFFPFYLPSFLDAHTLVLLSFFFSLLSFLCCALINQFCLVNVSHFRSLIRTLCNACLPVNIVLSSIHNIVGGTVCLSFSCFKNVTNTYVYRSK